MRYFLKLLSGYSAPAPAGCCSYRLLVSVVGVAVVPVAVEAVVAVVVAEALPCAYVWVLLL